MHIKAFFSFFLALMLCIGCVLSSSAASYVPYSGLTDTSSQASLLYGYYKNLDDFSYDDEFIIMRSDQNAYYLFYADSLSSSQVNYISYIGTSSSGYNTTYTISMGVENNFSFVINEYSVVGNIPGTVSYSDHDFSFNSYLIQIAAYALLILFMFFVFRSSIKELTS